MTFRYMDEMIASAFEAARPTNFMNVTEAGQAYHTVKPSALHRGKWSSALTPYLLEPQEILTSLEYQAVVIAAPARTGKSAVLMNWLAYGAKVDPTDYLIVGATERGVRIWSKDDLAKFLRASKDVRAMMIPGRKSDNVFDKEFVSGMRWQMVYPTIDNLSGKTIMRHWLLDYDRIPQSVEGEGNPFDLTKKRAETYLRFGMTVAESSPGFEITDPKWMPNPENPHEAPPVKDGILKLYNQGDRRRWYWRCEQCAEAFEPSFQLFDFPGKHDVKQVFADPFEAAEQVTLVCPHCGYPHAPDMKNHLNQAGRWVREGWMLTKNGLMVPQPGIKPARSEIASFWMKGPAAAFQTWQNMVVAYIRAEKVFEETGDEKPLVKSFNTDMGEPYLPKALISDRSPGLLKECAEDWGASEEVRSVPPWVRFLVATVDVQARSSAAFVVQVHGVDPDGNVTVVDSFKITKSERYDQDGDRLRIDPAAFPFDWDVLIDQVFLRTYPLSDGSGRRMAVYLSGGDSGGAEGVTTNAYAFWRRLKERGDGLHRKFVLIKGRGGKAEVTKLYENTPPTRVLWPDNNQGTKNFAAARGDVPVLELNPWILKNQASNMLLKRIREDGGAKDDGSTAGGAVRYPTWMPDWFYNQLTNEVYDPLKGWVKIGSRKNECWDLLYYALGLLARPRDEATNAPWLVIRSHRIDWGKPPSWAETWDNNSMIWSEQREEQRVVERKTKPTFKELAEKLA